jgi:hypothetical protein
MFISKGTMRGRGGVSRGGSETGESVIIFTKFANIGFGFTLWKEEKEKVWGCWSFL